MALYDLSPEVELFANESHDGDLKKIFLYLRERERERARENGGEGQKERKS